MLICSDQCRLQRADLLCRGVEIRLLGGPSPARLGARRPAWARGSAAGPGGSTSLIPRSAPPAAIDAAGSGAEGSGRAHGRVGRAPAEILEVRLEIAVVANLLVNLQTVALAIGEDDAVRGGSKSTAVGKKNRHCGSRLLTRRRAFAMSGLASTVCCPHFDKTCASPIRLAIGFPSESTTEIRWLPQSAT